MHPRIRIVAAATLLATLTAAPPWAHPGFQPDEVPTTHP